MATTALIITSSFLFILLSAPTCIVGENLVNKACGSSKSSAARCKACLNKSPSSANADLKGLASNILDCSIASATDARDVAVDLSHNDGGVLGACAVDFAQADIGLARARTFVHSSKFRAAGPALNTCADRYKDCINRFGNKEENVPKRLLSIMKNLQGECDAAVGILSNLS